MIRFVDIRNQGIGCRFSFWNTSTNRYLSFAGEQAWDDFEDFTVDVKESDALGKSYVLRRCRSLCPDWVFDGKEDDVSGWYEGMASIDTTDRANRPTLERELRGRLGAMAMCVLQKDWEGANDVARQVRLSFEDGPVAHIPWIEDAENEKGPK